MFALGFLAGMASIFGFAYWRNRKGGIPPTKAPNYAAKLSEARRYLGLIAACSSTSEARKIATKALRIIA